MERRLAAIFAADMVGYSRLMEADETGTLARQKRHRAELIDPKIAAHHGRIVKLTGDGMIADFPSVVEAVQCAVSIQHAMETRETDVPEERRIRYRVGVNLGDIIFDEGDVYGDGVNIAARLEALAEPGGVVVSGTAYDHLKSTVEVGYEDLGEHEVKNIARPVRVYRVVPGGKAILGRRVRRRWPELLAAVAVVALLVAGSAWWWMQRPEFEAADPAKMEYALDEPAIAVLAFDNLTGDPEQEHVSDGLSEDIIATLARLPGLVVIARNSSFSYKGQSVDVRRVAEELSVRYVVEGSLQQADETLRITVHLIDAIAGHDLWSEQFDRPREDFLKIRDEITREIVSEINSELIVGGDIIENEMWARADTYKTVETWILSRKARWHGRQFDRTDNQIAIELAQQILEKEPNSVSTLSNIAEWHAWNARANWVDDREGSLRLAESYAQKAITADDSLYPLSLIETHVEELRCPGPRIRSGAGSIRDPLAPPVIRRSRIKSGTATSPVSMSHDQ